MRLMHWFLLGLALAGLTSTATANPPAAALPTAPAVTAAPCCAVPTRHVCVPEVAPKTHTHVCYKVKCVHICLPNCDRPGGCKKACTAGDCGKPREVRRLIKRFVKEETGDVDCVHREVPAEPVCVQPCPAPCQAAHAPRP